MINFSQALTFLLLLVIGATSCSHNNEPSLDSSTDTNKASFKFRYFTKEFGSNAGHSSSGLTVSVEDTLFAYYINNYQIVIEEGKEPSIDNSIPAKQYFDPIYIDSIISILNTIKGQDISRSNRNIRSGEAQTFYFEFEGMCTNISLYNAKLEETDKISRIVNQFLPEENQIFFIPDAWKENRYDVKTKVCSGNDEETYKGFLREGRKQMELRKKNKSKLRTKSQ